jgi:hypothetical protein
MEPNADHVEEMEQAKKSGLVKQCHGIPREEGTPTTRKWRSMGLTWQ